MFCGCLSLLSFKDISKWNINNVTNINGIFIGCSSLITSPDISKWNTNNVTNMSGIFIRCLSLNILPDISNWNINNVIGINDIFSICKEISKIIMYIMEIYIYKNIYQITYKLKIVGFFFLFFGLNILMMSIEKINILYLLI